MEYIGTVKVGDKELVFEAGRLAKQASGSVKVTCGGTVVLATACSSDEQPENLDFAAFTVDYQERTYSAGKIPGGFFKREGRPSEKEILISRLIDRPIRPLIPDDYSYETQIVALVLSHDQENDTHTLAVCAASAALSLSDIPFNGPIGAVSIGLINDQFIVNPKVSELENSKMEMIIAGTSKAITMIEGRMNEVDEDIVSAAVEISQREIIELVRFQEDLKAKVGKGERTYVPLKIPDELYQEVSGKVAGMFEKLSTIPGKIERSKYRESIIENTKSEYPEEQHYLVGKITDEYLKKEMRDRILNEGRRIDGRVLNEIRPVRCEVGVLPRPHGSAIFQRGETASLCTVTLGSKRDEQKLDRLIGEEYKRFMVHYNFLPFSVGEVKWMRGPGRREIGHGILAERSLQYVIPGEDEFPYTIRLVSDILESNGSSSMATVCACSLAMMDSGIPVKSHVAGLSIGLVKEGDNYRLLTDIIGAEDHMGDMDFKVAGTREGITGIQLDTKIQDLSLDIIKEVLKVAKEGKLEILESMEKTIPRPRDVLSEYAPRIIKIDIPRDKIGEIIGPAGKTIREIISKTKAEIEIDDEEGVVIISASDKESVQRAEAMIRGIIKDVIPGEVYEGEVKKILPFGAIVNIGRGKDGLLHISEIAHYHVNKVEDILSVGDKVRVKVKRVDKDGKIDLSRKALISRSENKQE
ncbi:polyribonucleotide nucleotidyltransferase [candidate division WOR-3 bacterium]|nr:polyribonucleotide nucleotidyltransferase [candidate division WOR-3 bacterium]